LIVGGVAFTDLGFQRLPQQQEAPLLKAAAALSLVAANIVDGDAMVAGRAGGSVKLEVTRANRSATGLPQPLGEISDEFTIDRCSARAYQLKKGEFVQVIDVAGRQCSDFIDMVKLFDTPQLSGILHFQTLFFIIVRADITQRRM